jgi:hypothetical protein
VWISKPADGWAHRVTRETPLNRSGHALKLVKSHFDVPRAVDLVRGVGVNDGSGVLHPRSVTAARLCVNLAGAAA